MCGGGSAPPPVDPIAQAQAQILIQENQALLDAQVRAEEAARALEELKKQEAQFNTGLDSAVADAILRGRGLIEGMGLDVEQFLPLIEQEAQLVRRSVPHLDANPASYFGQDLAQTVLDRERDMQRQGFVTDIRDFAPLGFATAQFGDTSDDAILEAILLEQFTPANAQIQRAFDRGNLTQVGYNTALEQLDAQRTAGLARLQDVGGGVLTEGRNQLRDIVNLGLDRANTFELGQSFDPSSIQASLDAATTDFSNNLEGRIRSALGGEQLFNFEDIIARGGIAQGAQNPGAAAPAIADVLAARENERNQQRGIGNVGVF